MTLELIFSIFFVFHLASIQKSFTVLVFETNLFFDKLYSYQWESPNTKQNKTKQCKVKQTISLFK